MSDDGEGDRVSPRRLQQAFRDGYLPRSRWWQYAVVWGLAAMVLAGWSDGHLDSALAQWRSCWRQVSVRVPEGLGRRTGDSQPTGSTTPLDIWTPQAGRVWGAVALPGAVSMVVVLLVAGVQTSFRPFPQRFHWTGLSTPGSGLTSFALWSRFLLNVLYLTALVVAVVLWGWHRSEPIFGLASDPSVAGLRAASRWLAELLAVTALVSVVAGGAEYGLSYWLLWRQLSMSDEQWREEIRAVEGDPRVEARQRQWYRTLIGQAHLRRQES
ncbi:MAG: EscU/YscU/HrcU family type III secretion system export apparatus switch protein [Pirellulales bacterium]